MKRASVTLLAAMVAATLLIAGCGQAAPAPTPTKAPAAPTKAAEPTKPAAATAAPTKVAAPQPTAAPAKKVDFPGKGRTITWIAPWNAGGTVDGTARPMIDILEKDLGTSFAYVNKPGAGLQVGMTELALARPDGYTIGYTVLPNVVTIYLDPERKSAFTRNSFQPIALHQWVPNMIAVRADSPFKTLKDLVDAGKANPEKIKLSTTGVLGDDHLALLALERVTGARYAAVHLTGMAVKELLGGHIDATVDNVGSYTEQVKAGEVRVLGVMDKEASSYYPGVQTFEAQGYKVHAAAIRVISAPAGTPREIVDILSGSIKKVIENRSYLERMDQLGVPQRYMGPDEVTKVWVDAEPEIRALMDQAKAQIK